MHTRYGRSLICGLFLVGLLSGCATTVAQQEQVGLPTADNPEYLGHPWRLVALPTHLVGNILRYGLIEPFYFVMNTMPNAVGLSLEEQQYIQERSEAWKYHLDNPQKPLWESQSKN